MGKQKKSKFVKFLKKVKDICVDLIFPSNVTCDICGQELDHNTKYHICDNCLKVYSHNNNICKKCGCDIKDEYEHCYSCKHKQTYYKIARSPFSYSEKVKDAIHKLKYHNAKYLAETFGNIMTNTIINENFVVDTIIPVPLTQKRQKHRGYNQSELLAKQISKNLKINVLKDVLIRQKFTESQTELNYLDRYKNLEDSFSVVDKQKILGKKILLIDDVMTTGATVEACSKLLMENGANVVYVCTIARTASDK